MPTEECDLLLGSAKLHLNSCLLLSHPALLSAGYRRQKQWMAVIAGASMELISSHWL
jgi:hypothetical protein